MTRYLSSFLILRFVSAYIFFSCFVLNKINAQCSTCSATTFNVDLSAAIDTTYSVQSVRNGNCCTGSNCIRFNITINFGSSFVNFSVANPSPSGSAYYQIDCGPQTSIGFPVCVSGMTNVCIIYCKPGNDNPTYTITTSAAIRATADIYLREGCTGTMSVIGLQLATTTWTSIFPGLPGDYNSFLSCVSGCASTNVTPQAGAPPYIDYQVTGTKVCSGLASDTIRVYNVSPLTVSILPANPTICGSNSIVLTATPNGGAPPYKYLWNNGIPSQSITVNATGNYSVAISDKTNCPPVSQTVTVAAGATPNAPTATNNGPLCIAENLNLTASTVSGALYSWSGPNAFTSKSQNPVINNVGLNDAGIYSVTATVNGCSSTIATTTVTIRPVAVMPAVSSNAPLCDGDKLLLNTLLVQGMLYSWSGPNGFASTQYNPVINNVSLLNEGIYTLTITGCTTASNTTDVMVKPAPSTPIVSNNSPVCVGKTLNLTAGSNPGATYNWTGPNSFTSSVQNPVINNVTSLYAGTYNVFSFENGCNSSNAASVVIINPGPLVNAGPDRFVLENQTITLVPVVNGMNLQYLWTPNLYLSSDMILSPVVTGINDQVYVLKITDADGCSNEDDVSVKVLRSIIIPNTFTPNNDGINDTWIIKNLEEYPDCRVQVFNRYGQLVYESKGYPKPWDGTYNGLSMPFGTYYYIIEPGFGIKAFTGYVTIIK